MKKEILKEISFLKRLQEINFKLYSFEKMITEWSKNPISILTETEFFLCSIILIASSLVLTCMFFSFEVLQLMTFKSDFSFLFWCLLFFFFIPTVILPFVLFMVVRDKKKRYLEIVEEVREMLNTQFCFVGNDDKYTKNFYSIALGYFLEEKLRQFAEDKAIMKYSLERLGNKDPDFMEHRNLIFKLVDDYCQQLCWKDKVASEAYFRMKLFK